MLKKCEYCNIEFEIFESVGRKKKYCSKKCAERNRHDIKLTEEERLGLYVCKECGNSFKSHKIKRICSLECGKAYNARTTREKRTLGIYTCNRTIHKKVCKACNIDFETKWKHTIYCSVKCAMSTRRKIFDEYRGEKHFNDYFLKNWRKQVFKRDDHKCKCCGYDKGKILRAHHLEGWNDNIELRYVIDNGITLCNTCHISFHNKYGYGKNSKKQFEEFLFERRLIYADTI